MSVQTDLWDSLVADVITLTNRPELTDETQLAVRMGILRAHSCAHFVRDLVTTQTALQSSSSTLLQVATSTTLLRFRDVAAVRLLDVDGNVLHNPEIELVEANDIYEYGYKGVRKPYVAWIAGTALNVYAACGMYGVEVLWYQSPNVTRATCDSWIAQLFPDAIIWEAAMMVWSRTGNEAKAKEAYKVLYGTGPTDRGLYNELKSNFAITAGR